ncbi:MAG TPA: DUF4382 domain-containing protein [Telluria sp.]|nr:DUF4382 domain-containing protein [Telluria sp.]
MKHSSRITLLAAGAAAAAALAACGGGGGGSQAPAPVSSMGTLSVGLTDAPACGFDAVNVTVSKVRVNKSSTASDTDGGWTDVTLAPAKKINLLNLTNGVLETLGQTSLEAGTYTQIRLVLDANTSGTANTVVPTGTTAEQALDTPSAVQSGIKLVGQFDVAAGARSDIVIDFDACKSIVTKGNGKYALKPVVKMLPSAINGISGFVSTALLGSRVTVSAQQNGTIVSSTTPNATTGEFLLSRLVPGNYDVVITSDTSAASVVAAVPVASTTSNTALSTAAAPLTLASGNVATISGTVTLTPPSATEVAYVAAKQTFTAGPTVTIKYQGADLATGAYTLANLPVAAPQYATYSATLPLVFAASTTTTAGKYRVDASATGYTTKSVEAVDVTTQNQANVNFALVP